MSGRQLENGYLQIANEIIDDLCRGRLNGAQYQIIMVILKKTYGTCELDETGEIKCDEHGNPIKRKKAKISMTEFQYLTGLQKSTILAAMKLLVAWKVIVKNASRGGNASEYSYQKYAEKWVIPKIRHKSNFKQHNCEGDSKETVQLSSTVNSTIPRTVNSTILSTRINTYNTLNSVNNTDDKQYNSEDSSLVPESLEKTLSRYDDAQRQTIKEYWDVIRKTRTSGKLAVNIIKTWMDKWVGFPANTVIQSMEIHIRKYPTRNEKYTHGIVRRLQNEQKRGAYGGNSSNRQSNHDKFAEIDFDQFAYHGEDV